MAEDHNLILASRVEHTPVFNEDGWLIGHIKDISIDRESGEAIYVIVSFGGFLGFGTRLHPIPWHMLNYDTKKQGYVVPLDEESLKDAPHFEASELENFGGEHSAKTHSHIFDYYGPYAAPPI